MTTPDTTPRSGLGISDNLTAIKNILEGVPAEIDDIASARLGLFQDTGHDIIFWMGLPYYAPRNSGVVLGTYMGLDKNNQAVTRTIQALPIEGVSQCILPTFRSEDSTPLLTGDEKPPTAADVSIRRKRRREMVPVDGALRVNWHESYATHGGPYGLRALAHTPDLAVPFIIWQARPTEAAPRAGRIILAFNAYADIAEDISLDGITADITIKLDSFLYTPTLPINPEMPPQLRT